MCWRAQVTDGVLDNLFASNIVEILSAVDEGQEDLDSVTQQYYFGRGYGYYPFERKDYETLYRQRDGATGIPLEPEELPRREDNEDYYFARVACNSIVAASLDVSEDQKQITPFTLHSRM